MDLPDDGSIVDLDPRTQVSDFLASAFLGGFRGLPMLAVQHVQSLVFQFQGRSWANDDSVPEYGGVSIGSVVNPVLSEARYRIAVSLSEIVTEDQFFTQSRWRLAWLPVVGWPAHSYNFMNLRWTVSQYEALDPETDVLGPTSSEVASSMLWSPSTDPLLAPEFEAGDPETWPGTEWVETPLPTASAPAEPEPGQSAINIVQSRLRMLWPRPWSLFDPYFSSFGTFCQGRIPGARTMFHSYLRPVGARGVLDV